MSLPRIALIAGHGVDAQAWLKQVELPATFDWQIISGDSVVNIHDLSGLIWLWQPRTDAALLRSEKDSLTQWCRSIVRSRQNNLMPIMVCATDTLLNLDEESKTICMKWLKSVHFMIRNTYRHLLRGWVPAALVDASRITLQASTPESGQHLVELLQRLMTTTTLWKQRIERQAERCLAVGLVLVAVYVAILLITFPWTPRQPQEKRLSEPVSWSRTEWQYHIKDCQQLMQALGGRTFDKLSPTEQQRFTEHLRWLPISHDLLMQMRSTKEVIRTRGQVHELLQQMEALVDAWTASTPVAVLDQVAQQAVTRQLLDGVFEPRQPPTMLHQVARRYWLGERTATVNSIKAIWAQNIPLQQKLTEMAASLKERTAQTENCRVHAPELKTAWLQELSAMQSWLESAITMPATITPEELKKETTPGLLREVVGEAK